MRNHFIASFRFSSQPMPLSRNRPKQHCAFASPCSAAIRNHFTASSGFFLQPSPKARQRPKSNCAFTSPFSASVRRRLTVSVVVSFSASVRRRLTVSVVFTPQPNRLSNPRNNSVIAKKRRFQKRTGALQPAFIVTNLSWNSVRAVSNQKQGGAERFCPPRARPRLNWVETLPRGRNWKG